MVDKKRTIEKHEQVIEESKTLSVPEESEGLSVDKDVCKVYDSRANELLKDFEAFEEKPEGPEELTQEAFRDTYDLSLKSF